jgi:predicted naringenin-chalcone synthase
MTLRILGLGTALPPRRLDQQEALDLAQRLASYTPAQRRLLPALYRRAGVKRRHTVLEGPQAAPLRPQEQGLPGTAERMRRFEAEAGALATAAAERALIAGDVPPASLTHLVTVSCTGAAAPGVDVDLMTGLQMPAGVQRTHVGFMGCQGALAGLRVAHALAVSQPGSRVLLCAVELCSLHFHYGWDPEKVVANALFADGAGALVGEAGSAAPPGGWSLLGSASTLLPDSQDAMTWTIGDHGFEMTLSPRVPALIAEHLRPWLERWLAERALRLEDIGSWAVHPGGPRILAAVERALALPPEASATSREVLAEHGNMSSPTVLFILQRLAAEGARRPCLALGFGPGLVAEAALLG